MQTLHCLYNIWLETISQIRNWQLASIVKSFCFLVHTHWTLVLAQLTLQEWSIYQTQSLPILGTPSHYLSAIPIHQMHHSPHYPPRWAPSRPTYSVPWSQIQDRRWVGLVLISWVGVEPSLKGVWVRIGGIFLMYVLHRCWVCDLYTGLVEEQLDLKQREEEKTWPHWSPRRLV